MAPVQGRGLSPNSVLVLSPVASSLPYNLDLVQLIGLRESPETVSRICCFHAKLKDMQQLDIFMTNLSHYTPQIPNK